MMPPTEVKHYYWDTCVFVAFLNDERQAFQHHIDHIGQFLDDASAGRVTIYCSTITIAEITRASLIRRGSNTFEDFVRDFGDQVVQITPDPRAMRLASHLRSLSYTKAGASRTLQTPDAIHLATALQLTDSYGVDLTAFHSFDKGNRGGIPIVGFEQWCDGCGDDPVVKKVIGMVREYPTHPSPKLNV